MSQSALFIGNESLLIQCASHWLDRGHSVAAVMTRSPDIASWAQGRGLIVLPQAETRDPGGLAYDWLFSVANLSIVPDALIARAGKGAVNFHDGPLPRHAGLNAPAWAILAGESEHGVTWHMMEGGVDEGDIVEQRMFPIAPEDTTLTLNTRAYEAAIDSFAALVAGIEAGGPARRRQDLTQRSYHARADRPAMAARIDFAAPRDTALRLVRAMDHGDYANPLAVAKIDAGQVLAVSAAEPTEGAGAPGQVLAVDEAGLTVACADGAITLRGLRDMNGRAVCPKTVAKPGDTLPAPDPALGAAIAAIAPGEGKWRKALKSLVPALVPLAHPGDGATEWKRLPLAADPQPGLAAWVASIAGEAQIALHDPAAPKAPGYVSDWVPLRAGDAPQADYPAFALDLPLRDPAIGTVAKPEIAFSSADAPVDGSVLTVTKGALHYDAARLDDATAALLAARLDHFAQGGTGIARPEADLITRWNTTEKPFDSICIHQAFEAQAARTPDAPALSFENQTLTYAQLNAKANKLAHVLIGLGVGPGVLVGLNTRRSPLLLIGALGIMKAGGAYVPLDPAYPADRIALYIEDSAAPVIVTEAALEPALPPHGAQVVALDDDGRIGDAPDTNPDSGVGPGDLAYLIYTSGSTGRPKGVMLEHGNVANFFAGMDDRIDHAAGGVWLAVTSLSFDISVLELFWTLARGFRVVLMSDDERVMVSGAPSVSDRKMDFSLFYWGNDDGVGPAKYQLLLDGARFADTHGFTAVWTPERHFHAFGGPYPNPSVTGAAVAAVTQNLEVRAGSCVAPLHHPARIAEEWAVIDNLTNGRTGLGIASGWHPEDFVLRPENTPPANKPAMYDTIDKLRRMWRGEAVPFPMNDGRMVDVVTQPRPVSKELKIWVTTAGNPDTWREAGQLGANVLTHLLGQSIDEVGEKITIYHKALREAGHDPADFNVTLMLHSYVARDREQARRIAREPMKNYLRSAAALVKQYAWAFPAFKKPQGVSNPMDIDLRSLSSEETEAILDFAFQRYFEDSGLFGTVEDCIARVEQLKRIGVDEIACLIDYGIARDQVLEGLFPLAEVVKRTNAGASVTDGDYSISGQILRYGVTHLQCTPSMARMIAMNDDSRTALGRVKHLMIGGEALPGALVADLNRATKAGVTNMYGPTETTIWSTTAPADAQESVVSLGTPIANTQCYVLDEAGAPVPIGAAGELWIGGAGVARGYWQREDLTADRFRANPFGPGRIYGTGDLVRWTGEGRLEFLGRADHQVKLRGYRIELGEIEAQAEAFPGVRQAVVMAREDIPGDLRLVAYVTGDTWLVPDTLRDHLARALPAHMVPSAVVKLADFPLTPNRKVDRKALPAPLDAAPPLEDFVAPESGVQAVIAGVWARVLNRPAIGAKDNFFALGGHSLLAVQAHREIKEALQKTQGQTRLTITDIFRFPTLEALAAHLGEGATAPATEPAADTAERAAARTDAMSRRRDMRANRMAARQDS